MKFCMRNHERQQRKSGQILVLFAAAIVVLILFVGLGIDLSFSYITKAQLSKAVDAACLAAARNLYQGKGPAQALALSTFAANYGVSGRDVKSPKVEIKISTDSHDNQVVDIKAKVTINTYFIRILPQWATLTVASTGEATRTKVIMSLVLDRSGSMTRNKGAEALPPAVKSFINFFDDQIDNVAMISFASIATVDVLMEHDFKGPINTALDSLNFTNCTFSQGGLAKASAQNDSIKVLPGDTVIKIVVFFTDGLANMFQDTLGCPSPTLLNIGGFDENNDPCVGFNFPDNETRIGTKNCPWCGPGNCPINFCPDTTKFQSVDGSPKDFNRFNTTAEAQKRALNTALDMKRNGTVIYAIGLGSEINSQFLLELANDPASVKHDPNLPTGQAVFAPTAGELNGVFQAIATKILVRLSK